MSRSEPQWEAAEQPSHSPLRLPLFLFGVGLGAFVDGIVLHQILQWHHMISDTERGPTSTVAGLEANTIADGVFHLVAFTVVVVALFLLTRRQSGHPVVTRRATVVGWLLVGWSGFNLVEGPVNHHLLTLHHVRDNVADPLGWDLGFLAISALLLVVGFVVIRRTSDAADAPDGATRGPTR